MFPPQAFVMNVKLFPHNFFYDRKQIRCYPYSIMDASFVSRIWSVRIHGMDISMGNWILRPIVSSRKNSLNQSWERSQHCCKVSVQRNTEQRCRHVWQYKSLWQGCCIHTIHSNKMPNNRQDTFYTGCSNEHQAFLARDKNPVGTEQTLHNMQRDFLTTEVQHMGVKEGFAVKLLNVKDGGTFQTATQSLFRATFVRNERLKHSPHHIELHRQKCRWCI